MKNRKISGVGLVAALMVAGLIGGGAARMFGPIGGGVLALLSFAVMFFKPWLGSMFNGAGHMADVHMAGVAVEIWQNHIEKNLFKNNDFLLRSMDASQYVLEGKIVHIPQAGATPSVVKNRSSLPASVTQRTDTDVTYNLDQYTTDPFLLNQAELIEASYDKRESVLAESEAALRQTIADTMIITWCPSAAASIIRTTGAAVPTHLTGTTGNRKKFTVADLKKAMNLLNKQNIPMEGRVALMSADMYNQFTDELTATQYRDFSAAYDEKSGILGRLFSFDIYMRSATCSYTNAATPVVQPYGTAAAADDNDTVLCWQQNTVERAVGSILFRERLNDPTYFGDVYSTEMRMGGRQRRTDGKGIIAIVQDAA